MGIFERFRGGVNEEDTEKQLAPLQKRKAELANRLRRLIEDMSGPNGTAADVAERDRILEQLRQVGDEIKEVTQREAA